MKQVFLHFAHYLVVLTSEKVYAMERRTLHDDSTIQKIEVIKMYKEINVYSSIKLRGIQERKK